ncbi:MAG: GemA protein [Rhodobacterales bacterium 17-64-5]|nr:MAG: GemA protein [Rhodobacterales bacterium 17-64-5]
MTLNRRQTALLHVVKKQLAWDDDLYRRVLVKVAGVTSSKDLDEAGFNAVMGFAEYAGFKPLKADGPNFGKRQGFASPAQVDLIRVLWIEAHHGAALDEDALNGWLLKYWKVSSLRFVTAGLAPKIITAMKSWKSRAA